MRRLVRLCAIALAFGSGWLIASRPDHGGPLTAADRVEASDEAAGPPVGMAAIFDIPAPEDLARPEPPASIVPTALRPAPSGWRVLEEEAATGGLRNVYLSVPSDAPLTCGPRRRATLFLRCFEDRTAVYVAHDCQTPPDPNPGWDVTLQLDDTPPTEVRLEVDARGESFGFWTYRDARDMAEALASHETLDVRFTDGSGRRERMRFPVADLAEPLARLAAACHWSDVPPWRPDAAGTGTDRGPDEEGARADRAPSALGAAAVGAGDAGPSSAGIASGDEAATAQPGPDPRPMRPSGAIRHPVGSVSARPAARPDPGEREIEDRAG